jgi:hypothetical protein
VLPIPQFGDATISPAGMRISKGDDKSPNSTYVSMS